MRNTRTKAVKTGTVRYQVVSADSEKVVYGEYSSKAIAEGVCAFLNLGVRQYNVVKI